jgi:hypothetical protein
MPEETPPVSPNGQLVGVSALLNKLPPWAMHVAIGIAVVAALVKICAKAMPTTFPPGSADAADGVLAIAVPAAMASAGARA